MSAAFFFGRVADLDIEISTQKRPSKWITIPIVIWVLLGAFPIFGWKFGFPYLPAPNWIAATRSLAIISGVITALLLLIGYIKGSQQTRPNDGLFTKVFLGFFALVLGFVIGTNAVTTATPMIVALVVGQDSSVDFSVSDVSRGGDYRCPVPIVLKGLPYMFNKVCDFPASLRDSLAHGDTLTISGHGTRWGLFPDWATTY